ncbi:MAG: hypothetical protein Q8876_07995, partial [Bacillota bacterium]|nr:hypothetical protein [Bacillota bacterium]
MQDERENNIEYNEGWQEISTPQFRDDFLHNYEYENENKSEDNTNREELNDKLVKPRKSASNEPKQTLILFQLIICAFIALCAIALKQFGGDIYNIAH